MPIFMGAFGLWRVSESSVPIQKSGNSGGLGVRGPGILDGANAADSRGDFTIKVELGVNVQHAMFDRGKSRL